ncbi:Hypothetical predicted protein [Paramuricea clavata]|uniref:Uncharacterized protein n=1 Tax=Paramuricea clavata TaxID=317549 RepID=A0A6S7GUJ9_PARCT|nr:Hypothetical predicted protein [Paramuricea clavata]
MVLKNIFSSPEFLLESNQVHSCLAQPEEVEDTVQTLKDNTYVDNIMQIGSDVSELEGAKLPLHKWESNVESLGSEDMPNPSKILGLVWDKKEDELHISTPEYPEGAKVTKKSVVSHLGKVYDPLGRVSPTMAEGKRIYREACNEAELGRGDFKALRTRLVKVDKTVTNS